MSKLYPHQQEIIDRLRAASPTARRIFDIPVMRSGVVSNADRVDERGGSTLMDADFSDLERRVVRNAMFGVRYGKTWTGKLHPTSWREFLNEEMPEVPPRRTLMFYHVQNALMGWVSK